MTSLAQASVAYLPVTALLRLKRDESTWFLAGQGPDLVVLDENRSKICLRSRVLNDQTIHGLIPVSNTNDRTINDEVQVLIWGGRQICLASLKSFHNSENCSAPILRLILSKRCEAQDWILKIVIPPPPVSSTRAAYLLTAKNSILGVTSTYPSNLELWRTDLEVLTQGPKAFLYAGDIFQVEDDLLVVASGTAFGEILLWKCNRDQSTLRWYASLQRIFLGHKGSIFGVCISEALNFRHKPQRLLASCSDDRTIRIWNIGDTDDDSIYTSKTEPSQCAEPSFSGYSETQPYAMTWAHISRIWNVEFVPQVLEKFGKEHYFLSQGEDATSQLWLLQHSDHETELATKPSMQLISSDRYHVGKNIWSMRHQVSGNETIVHTGGADGRIVSRSYPLCTTEQKQSRIINIKFKDISVPMQALKQYHILSQTSILAITDHGELLNGDLKNGRVNWQSITIRGSSSELMLCQNHQSHVAYVSDTRGNITILTPSCNEICKFSLASEIATASIFVAYESYLAASSTLEICLIATTKIRSEVVLNWTVSRLGELQTRSLFLVLPPTFSVTSAIYAKDQNTIILGSRAGALAIYPNIQFTTETFDRVQCYRHIHGEDAVTSILLLPQAINSPKSGGENQMHLLTTGRDGTFAVHRVHLFTVSDKCSSLETVHSSSATFGSHIEGAYLVPGRTRPESFDIALYGFRSKDFVVWHQALDIPLFEIECGGAHRSWDYKAGIVSTASFAWTKAGSFNLFTQETGNHKVIQPGGHGREIKALAQNSSTFGDLRYKILATGAEDTTIRLFAIDTYDECRSIATLKQHTTGIQCLAFSECGNFLFSSASCEEFMVWRLWPDIPCFEIGSTFLDGMPKQELDRDARITSFDVRTERLNDCSDIADSNFTFALAYSNGKIKIVSYFPRTRLRRGQFECVYELSNFSFCLTQIDVLGTYGNGLFKLLSAGTNGVLNFHCLRDIHQSREERSNDTDVHRVHQSTIMTMINLQISESLRLVVTGGDDNALAITFLQISGSTKTFSTLLIPKAHAAALMALSVISISHGSAKIEVDIVSGGNDQKVKLWRISFPARKLFLATEADQRQLNLVDVNVEKIFERWTAVADVSAVQILRPREDFGGIQTEHEFRVMVVGVGMEILRFKKDQKL